MKTIAFANQKGGVGKTTSAINVASALSKSGFKILLVDTDPQGSCSIGVGAVNSLDNKTPSMCELLTSDKTNYFDVVQKTEFDNIDIIPAGNWLALAEMKLSSQGAKEFKLRKKLREYPLEYDFILIDCPPTFGTLSINAFIASDYIIMPLQLKYFALEGVSNFIDTLNYVNDDIASVIKHETTILGVILTFFDIRTNLAKQIKENVDSSLGKLVFETKIPVNIKLDEAQTNHKPIFDYDDSCSGAMAYGALCGEILGRLK